MDSFYDLSCSILKSLTDFFWCKFYFFRKTGKYVSSFYFHDLRVYFLDCSSDSDFDRLRGIFTDKQPMRLANIADDSLIKRIPCHLDRRRNNHTANWDHRNICRSSSDIHDQVSKWFRDVHSGSDCCRDRFFYEINFTRSRLICCFFYGFALDLRDSARYADTDSRLTKRPASHCLCNKIFQHFFQHHKVHDHSLANWSNHFHVGVHMITHLLCFFSDRTDLLSIFIIYNDRRFLQYKTLACRIYKTIRRSKIYSYIICRHKNPLP